MKVPLVLSPTCGATPFLLTSSPLWGLLGEGTNKGEEEGGVLAELDLLPLLLLLHIWRLSWPARKGRFITSCFLMRVPSLPHPRRGPAGGGSGF